MSTKETGLFDAVNRSALAVNQAAAGAGATGLLGFAALFLVATLFFVTENYFVAMALISVALLVYVSGSEVAKLFMSSVTIFFSSKHLTPRAAQLQEALVALRRVLEFKRDAAGELRVGPMPDRAQVRLPDNLLVRDIKAVIDSEKPYDYSEYVAHAYYVECHELYDSSHAHFEFVSGAMPLFGLIGTILGLIAMFDSLGGNVTVEELSPQLALALKTTLYGAIFSSIYKIIGSRFDQRLKSLDYDFETFCRGLQVLSQNRVDIEIQR